MSEFTVSKSGYELSSAPVGTRIKNTTKKRWPVSRTGGKGDSVQKKIYEDALEKRNEKLAERVRKFSKLPLTADNMPISLIKTQLLNAEMEAKKRGLKLGYEDYVKLFTDVLTPIYESHLGNEPRFSKHDKLEVFYALSQIIGNLAVHINRPSKFQKGYVMPNHNVDYQCRNLAKSAHSIGLIYTEKHVAGIRKISPNAYVVFNQLSDDPETRQILQLITKHHNKEDGVPFRQMEIIPFFDVDVEAGQNFQSVLQTLSQNKKHMYFLFFSDFNLQDCPLIANQEYEKQRKWYPRDGSQENERINNYFDESISYTQHRADSCFVHDVLGNVACQTLVWIFLLPLLPWDSQYKFFPDREAAKYLVLNNWKTLRQRTGLVLSVLPSFGARALAVQHSERAGEAWNAQKCQLLRNYAVEIFQKLDTLREIPPDIDVKPSDCTIS